MSEADPGSEAANHGRFRKGRSGNPGGRPRKRPVEAVSAFDIVVGKTLTVTRNGIAREITMEEALQHRTYQDAIAGKRMAQRAVLKWIEKREAWLAKHARRATIVPIRSERMYDSENADEALILLGIAAESPNRAGPGFEGMQLKLEPWAVQAGLARWGGKAALDMKERDKIIRCTRDSASLRWPHGGDR